MRVSRRPLLFVLAAAVLASCARPLETSRVPTSRPDVGTDRSPEHPYLKAMRAQIERFWKYPCVSNPSTGGCDHKTADLTVEVGVHPDGRLAGVRVVKSSGLPIYDDYAVNSIKLASPFAAVPEDLKRVERPVTTIQMRFNYAVDGPQRFR